ncbi:MAG TPA: hypothetical protein GX714_02225 [Chloroflexi bacterium]|nr:hypothetical protein [Chloroflexota bacterium]
MWRNRVFAGFAVLVLLLGLVVPSALSQSPVPGGEPLGEESRIVDAQWYVSTYNVSLEEALRRLQLQDDIDGLEPALIAAEGDTFAGLWIQHVPEFRLVIAFTEGGEETVVPYVEGQPWAELVEVRTMSATLAQLVAALEETDEMMRELGIRGDLVVDVKENRVQLRVTNQGELDAALQRTGMRLPDHVAVVPVERLVTPVADIFGGKNLNSPDGNCTSGFSVVHTDGTKGVATAGHCPGELTFEGVALPLRSRIYGGPWDVQWHRADHAFTVRNLFWEGTYNRYVYGLKARDSQEIGETVCRYGRTRGYSCGHIEYRTLKPTGEKAPPDATYTYIWVLNAPTDFGDSGGPVFFNNTAYGIIHGTTDGSDLVYMAADYIASGLSGVSILTY